MGLLDKVKNLFTEEVEEEMPIKREVKHIEIPNPRREIMKEERPIPEPVIVEEKKEPISDNVTLNREERFKFPVYFDDKDFEDLPKQEPPKKVEVKKEEPKVEPYKAAKMIEEKKNFKPSPIISPVYGVLDKNYKKDDIATKKERPVKRYHREEKLTIDDVRNKAYGTLEDDLENSLLSQDDSIVFEQEPTYDAEIDIFKELENTEKTRESRGNDLLLTDIDDKDDTVDLTKELERQKQKIDEINAFIKQNTVAKEVPAVEEKKEVIEEDLFEEPEPLEEKKETLDNGDLFDLIDSMYEKREEE